MFFSDKRHRSIIDIVENIIFPDMSKIKIINLVIAFSEYECLASAIRTCKFIDILRR